nr:glycosyltransferase [cf. Phormidesmis sp. LEGE 11477]
MFLSTPVGPLGSGLGGGVELTVFNLSQALSTKGHQIDIAAPEGSSLPQSNRTTTLIQIPGKWQPTAQTQDRLAPITVGSLLANAWTYARERESAYDLLVNFAYDWLPFYLTPFLKTPVAHFVSMGSLNNALDEAIAQTAVQFPGTLGAYTRSQVQTFPIPEHSWQILGSAIDIRQYDYCDHPDNFLAWIGRISPEKGLEDAITAAATANRPLKVFGKIEDASYWQSLQPLIHQATVSIEYGGFRSTSALQKALGRSLALLVTPKWTEAFGMVAIEALACGVPVIAYARGGPAEIVRDGQTGWLVSPDDVTGLTDAIANLLDRINRADCRYQAECLYDLPVWSERFEQWFFQILSGHEPYDHVPFVTGSSAPVSSGTVVSDPATDGID